MSLNWKTMSLDEVIVKRNQGVNTTTEKVAYSDAGIKVIRANNISAGIVDYSNCVYVTEETFERIKDTCKPQKGDILYTNIGSQLGSAALVNTDENFVIAWNVLRLQTSNKINADFLVYLLNNPSNKKMIQSLNSSSTMPFVSGGEIGKVEFSFPDLNKQIAIAKILRSLDDKIHLNNQINQTLESIAQAIFKCWFIDFEPVRAKIAAKQEGKDPERAAMCAISGKSEAELDQLTKEDFAELQATAALFPDELVESELGEVPKGWELQQLKDIAKYSSNKILLNDLNLENYISTENMLPEKKGIEKASSLPKANSVPAFRQGNILVSNIRPYFKKIWFSFFDGGHSNDVLNFDVLEKGTEEYLYNLIYQDSFFDRMMASSKGSKMPRGDKKAIMDFQIIVPPISLRCLYSAKVRSFYFYQNKLKIENQTLIDLRDTLLPRLLSGEVDVSGLQGEGIDG